MTKSINNVYTHRGMFDIRRNGTGAYEIIDRTEYSVYYDERGRLGCVWTPKWTVCENVLELQAFIRAKTIARLRRYGLIF